MFEIVNRLTNRLTDSQAPARWLYYTLIFWAFGSGELKIQETVNAVIRFVLNVQIKQNLVADEK